ncbi:MAG: diaminopimelate epimerase [bacterium]
MVTKKVTFSKMSGSNNDFIIVDNTKGRILRRSAFAKQVCQRRLSVGADGLILIERSRRADFRMRIFNPDGSEAEMCGNGARCAALFASKLVCSGRKNLTINTMAGILDARIMGADRVKLRMSDPMDIKKSFEISGGKKKYKLSFANTGVPHAVIFVGDINKVDVCKIGKAIRYHSYFSPKGTNVNFVQVKDKDSIYIRTYERGVEDETLACGTGSVASAVISWLEKGLLGRVNVYTRGGSILTIHIENDGKRIHRVYLEGDVKQIYDGTLTI